jgi:hypothetical protein
MPLSRTLRCGRLLRRRPERRAWASMRHKGPPGAAAVPLLSGKLTHPCPLSLSALLEPPSAVGVEHRPRARVGRQVKPALRAGPPGDPHVVPAPPVPAFRALEVADVAGELGELALVKRVSGRLHHELGAVELCMAAVVVKRGGEHHLESRATSSLRKPIAGKRVSIGGNRALLKQPRGAVTLRQRRRDRVTGEVDRARAPSGASRPSQPDPVTDQRTPAAAATALACA